MVKRILTIAAGIALGGCLTLGAMRLALAWGLFPNRELDHASSYFREVVERVNDNYVDGKASEYPTLTRAALRGMLDSLDPHSEFLDAQEYQQLEEDMNSEFGGIGVQVELRNEHILIVAPIAGSPSDRAGLRRGDEIVKIDGQALEKPDMDDVVSRLRGKPRSRVKLSLYRPSTKQNFEITLVRELIKTDSVLDVEVLPGGVGYIQLSEFTERSGEEFIKALNKLGDLGATSLVIDLRNNPGGLLDAAVSVAEPFFKKGDLIVYTQGRKPKDRDEYRAQADDPPLNLPTAVLINENSASAAEIVAGALRDTGKAVIVGERSFGKGSVQSIFPLRDGEGMRLTTARYYTPSGVTLHEKGVQPNVEVVLTPEEDENLRLQRSRRDVKDPAEFKERFGIEPIEDTQLETAADILRGMTVLDERLAAETKLPPAKAHAPTAAASVR